MEKAEVSNIDNMVISLLNQDRDSFSTAFSDAMKERLSGKLGSITQEISKEFLSVEEGWADKALSAVASAGTKIAAKGAKFAADNPNTMKAAKRAGRFAKEVGQNPEVRAAASKAMGSGGGSDGDSHKGHKHKDHHKDDQATRSTSAAGAIGKAAFKHMGAAWKKKRAFQKAKETGAPPPLKLASSYQPKNNELVETNYTFNSPRTAKNFMSSATQAGINKRDISVKGKSVTVGNIRDNDMKDMIHYLAKEMKAHIKESLIPALQLAMYTDETAIVEAKNGIDIHITPKDASLISHIHDNLNEDNQNTMRQLMLESEEDYAKILDFCKKQFIEEESNHVN